MRDAMADKAEKSAIPDMPDYASCKWTYPAVHLLDGIVGVLLAVVPHEGEATRLVRAVVAGDVHVTDVAIPAPAAKVSEERVRHATPWAC